MRGKGVKKNTQSSHVDDTASLKRMKSSGGEDESFMNSSMIGLGDTHRPLPINQMMPASGTENGTTDTMMQVLAPSNIEAADKEEGDPPYQNSTN